VKILNVIIILAVVLSSCKTNPKENTNKPASAYFKDQKIEHKVDSVLNLMTLEEKIGQTVLFSSGWDVTGPTLNDNYLKYVKEGICGNIFNAHTVKYNKRLQKIAVEETRLGIPLLFGYDVIHGHKTIFPISLGEASSWDMEAIEKSARVAAIEASASGLNWTFAPMCDISRDPRWGRISEGAGEDVFLAKKIAVARVHGFQGKDLSAPNTIMACVKHFAAYGAPQGGRDYNTVDMSDRVLRETYLPPYKAAIDAGAGTIMTSFNELDGVPSSGNHYLLTDILRNEWGFNGFVVTDYTSINEMVDHGIVANEKESAELAMNAGVDMDMQGSVYLDHLKALIKEGKVDEKRVEEAARRVLRMKFYLGLFDDPYRYLDEKRETEMIYHPDHLKASLDVAKKSMVLLQNDETLPLSGNKKIAIIGPHAKATVNLLGSWRASGGWDFVTSPFDAIKKYNKNLYYAEGCAFDGNDKKGFAQAVSAAKKSDVVLLFLGASENWSGEAASRTSIELPQIQTDLLKAVSKTGKPIVLVLMNGRPLALEREAKISNSILEAWYPGTEGGFAIADVLFGKYNPSGKLPVTFPRVTGQIPIYYGMKNTGRPYTVNGSEQRFVSRYLFTPNTPLFAFGHGLSYSHFTYSDLKLSAQEITKDQKLTVSIRVTNDSKVDGTETVQLYIRDLVGSVTRPVKQLRGFQKVAIKAGETKTINFTLSNDDLKFYRKDMSWGSEPGKFNVFVGGASDSVLEENFFLRD